MFNRYEERLEENGDNETDKSPVSYYGGACVTLSLAVTENQPGGGDLAEPGPGAFR